MNEFLLVCVCALVVGIIGLRFVGWVMYLWYGDPGEEPEDLTCTACNGTGFADYAAVPCEVCGG